MSVKALFVLLPKDLHFAFVNRCKFYDIDKKTVVALLIEKFLEGEFDEEFGIPSDSERKVS